MTQGHRTDPVPLHDAVSHTDCTHRVRDHTRKGRTVNVEVGPHAYADDGVPATGTRQCADCGSRHYTLDMIYHHVTDGHYCPPCWSAGFYPGY